MKNFKKILVIFVALVVFVATIVNEYALFQTVEGATVKNFSFHVAAGQSVQLWHGDLAQTFQGPADIKLQKDDRLQNNDQPFLEIDLTNRSFLRLEKGTILKVTSSDQVSPNFAFQLEQGRVWMNNLFDASPLTLQAGAALILPLQSVVNVDREDGKTTIVAYRHETRVDLVSPASPKTILNNFLLTQGNQTTLYDDDVQNNLETIQKLLYSKLIKEFQYGLFDVSTVQNDLWVLGNVERDNTFKKHWSDDQLQRLRERGLKVGNLNTFGFQFLQVFERVRNVATFDDQAKIKEAVDQLFDQLHDAEYFSIFGRTAESQERLQYFTQLLTNSALHDNASFQALFTKTLEEEHASLAFVSSTDALFPLRLKIDDLLLQQYSANPSSLAKEFSLIHGLLEVAYDAVNESPTVARNVLDEYYKRFVQFASAQASRLRTIKNTLAEENQVMDNLLRQYPQFYRDNIFAMKNNLEQQWLSTIDLEGEKNEAKLNIISTKIDFLKQLQAFFLADKVTIEDARQIVFRLFREADELQLPPDAQVAVVDLFNKRLQDFGIFFRFLNSPDYVNTTLHGSTHQEQFQQFLQLQQTQQVDIEDLRKEILNETSPSSSTAQDVPNAQDSTAQNAVDNSSSSQVTPPSTSVINPPGDTTNTDTSTQPVKVPVKRKK